MGIFNAEGQYIGTTAMSADTDQIELIKEIGLGDNKISRVIAIGEQVIEVFTHNPKFKLQLRYEDVSDFFIYL